MRYLPFLSGIYTTAPGLVPMSKALQRDDQLVFQIDETYERYLDNKRQCREENIGKYYLEERLNEMTAERINRYIVDQLATSHPDKFQIHAENRSLHLTNLLTGETLTSKDWIFSENSQYTSLFDALCSQVQEDLAIVQLGKEETSEYLAAIHLCSPNHWSPAEKIGKPFSKIHDPVPNMERVLHNYGKMLSSIVTSRGPFTRFAWGIATDTRLNHHPEAPPGIDHETWHGRAANTPEEKFYVRTERQNLIGFPEVNAFLFTIRTYFYNIESLSKDEMMALDAALNSMTPEARAYKGLTNTMTVIRKKLRDAIQSQ
jgi:dimethylamine monooxygenase subunit A